MVFPGQGGTAELSLMEWAQNTCILSVSTSLMLFIIFQSIHTKIWGFYNWKSEIDLTFCHQLTPKKHSDFIYTIGIFVMIKFEMRDFH